MYVYMYVLCDCLQYLKYMFVIVDRKGRAEKAFFNSLTKADGEKWKRTECKSLYTVYT